MATKPPADLFADVQRGNNGGVVSWTHKPGDVYHVTGVKLDGQRFRIVTSNWHYAKGINVWRGTKWLVRLGHRVRLVSVWN